MLCWICPDCGRDCSPAVRECPSCAQGQTGVTNGASSSVTNGASASTNGVLANTNGVLAMLEQLRAVPSVPLLAPAPQQYLLFGLTNGELSTSELTNGHGHSSVAVETTVAAEEDPALPSGETIDSLVRPLVESAKAAPVEIAPAKKPPTPAFVELAAPIGPPQTTAPLIQPGNPSAAQPDTAPRLAAQPNPFLARVAQIAELRIPARSSPKTAASVGSPRLPSPEPPSVTSLPKTEPLSVPLPSPKMVELPIPPSPPCGTAPRIQSSKPPVAQPTPGTAPRMPQPAPFPLQAPQIAGLGTGASPSPKLAALIHAAAAPTPQPSLAAVASSAKSSPFAATKPVAPKLAVPSEPFCAAIGFIGQAGAISEALKLQAEAVLDEIKLGLDAYESKIQGIVATFQARPALALLAAPCAIVAAPAPPDLQWMKMPRPVLAARKPSDRKCDSSTNGPQKPPLAGPCLPPELQNFIEPLPDERTRSRKGIGLPAWITSLVVATSLFLVVGVMMQHMSGAHEAKAAVAPSPSQVAASAPAAPAFEQHPFARFVEVTGLRVVADLNHRSQVQYIVVNHSATQLSGMSIRIAVRSSSDPAGSAPLFTVSAVIPSLGPHQSKEIRTDLDSQLRSSSIPDWEYLRTDVQIGTQN